MVSSHGLFCVGCAYLNIRLSRSRVCSSMSYVAVCWQSHINGCVAQSFEIVFEMLSSSIVRMNGCSEITRDDSCSCNSSLFHVAFAIALVECVAAAESSRRSTSTMLHGVNVGMTRIDLS